PAVVYGPWWWPAYPPYAYYPIWPGVAIGGFVGFGFFGAVAVGPIWGWGWGGHNVNINVNRNININRNVNISRNSIRTTSLHQAAAAGRIGSGRARATAVSRTGAGRTGVTGGGAGGRPSAGSIQQGL